MRKLLLVTTTLLSIFGSALPVGAVEVEECVLDVLRGNSNAPMISIHYNCVQQFIRTNLPMAKQLDPSQVIDPTARVWTAFSQGVWKNYLDVTFLNNSAQRVLVAQVTLTDKKTRKSHTYNINVENPVGFANVARFHTEIIDPVPSGSAEFPWEWTISVLGID